MNMVLIIMGTVLAVLFFLNIKSAADVLCRTVGGFVILLLYNAVAMSLSVPPVGINLISALLTGLLGLPGGALLIFCAILL